MWSTVCDLITLSVKDKKETKEEEKKEDKASKECDFYELFLLINQHLIHLTPFKVRNLIKPYSTVSESECIYGSMP